MGGAEGGGDGLEVGVGGDDVAEHLFVALDGELGEVVGDSLELDAEHGGEVFFVAEEDVDLLDEFAIDFLGLGFAADGLPERIAEVEVEGDEGAVFAGGVHGFVGDGGGGLGEGGEDASGMEPAGAVLGAKDVVEVEVSGFDLGDGGDGRDRSTRRRRGLHSRAR